MSRSCVVVIVQGNDDRAFGNHDERPVVATVAKVVEDVTNVGKRVGRKGVLKLAQRPAAVPDPKDREGDHHNYHNQESKHARVNRKALDRRRSDQDLDPAHGSAGGQVGHRVGHAHPAQGNQVKNAMMPSVRQNDRLELVSGVNRQPRLGRLLGAQV